MCNKEVINQLKTLQPFRSTVNRNNMLVFHRTRKKNASSILANGFTATKSSKRAECGKGIYAFANLADANSSYAKKTYGNYIVRFEFSSKKAALEVVTKVEAMKLTKAGVEKNFKYNISYLGDVIVLNDLSIIERISISKDGGLTWESNKPELVEDYFGEFHEITEHEKNMLCEMEYDIDVLENSYSENISATEADRFFRELREICSRVEAYFEERFGSSFLFSH